MWQNTIPAYIPLSPKGDKEKEVVVSGRGFWIIIIHYYYYYDDDDDHIFLYKLI